MATVVQLQRTIPARGEPMPVAGVCVRRFGGPADIDAWLALRDRSFVDQSRGVRAWSRSTFAAEITSKLWWQPEQMWLAESKAADDDKTQDDTTQLAGSVTLALRGAGPDARPVVHWLMVDPGWHRRGIGALLMAELEAHCWDSGHRQIWLETHGDWREAARFYESLGYTAT